jgi:hypothetical protein
VSRWLLHAPVSRVRDRLPILIEITASTLSSNASAWASPAAANKSFPQWICAAVTTWTRRAARCAAARHVPPPQPLSGDCSEDVQVEVDIAKEVGVLDHASHKIVQDRLRGRMPGAIGGMNRGVLIMAWTVSYTYKPCKLNL